MVLAAAKVNNWHRFLLLFIKTEVPALFLHHGGRNGSEQLLKSLCCFCASENLSNDKNVHYPSSGGSPLLPTPHSIF